ncbi:putative mucin TcMUCII [Trypanosoma cruzi]|uniref:Putative mucin TcMUCII n=1 Tax=Trypanosoma cruzi TaxID=5693 RepID=A0A2V2X4P5_TRYCR|nr:putative mucin TcMUCII [Trypanosoma cruzi]
MMTTCRLLCALLVLALCCCPSVCALVEPEPKVDVQASQTTTTNTTQPPTAKPVEAIVGAPSQSTLATGGASQETGHSDPSTTGPVASPGDDGGEGSGSTSTAVLEPKVSTEPNKSLTEGTNGMTGQQSRTETSAEEKNKESEASAQTTTTTTTTQAPTTSTTTTTQAPSTTTTEAPAVSTTRAPSRLREIDGSLSSSAWVCAPLLLAVSALAYTTLD